MTGDREISTTEWRLPRVLTAPHIEDWVASLPAETRRVVIRLGEWDRTGPFADARLQGALCLLHRKGIQTVARVPPVTLIGDRAPIAFEAPNPWRKQPLTPTERKLAGSVAGLTIGQLCEFGPAHSKIPLLQRQTLERRRYLFGWGDQAALAVPVDDRLTGVPRLPTPVREARFNNRLQDLLRPLAVTFKTAGSATHHWFRQLRTFAFEASENTWDHGQLDFEARPIPSIRFVRLRRIDVGGRGFDIEKVAPGFEGVFGEYLDSLTAATDIEIDWHRKGVRLIEITVADGGVGIAAKMAKGLSVFDDSIDLETRHLLNALLPDSSTKDPRDPGRGQGFRKMLRACFVLSGLTIVRTGRLRASKTYRGPHGTVESVDFADASSDTYVPTLNSDPLPLLAGTAVSMIFPIHGKARPVSRS